MNFIEYLLVEAREDYIAKQMGPKIMDAVDKDTGKKPDFDNALDVVNYLSKIHPKYIQWIVKQYIAGKFKLEDRIKIKDELTEFDRVKTKLEKKDINQYKTLKDLYDALKPFSDMEVVSTNQLEKDIKKKGAKKVLDTDSVLMYKIINKEAACILGKGTRWCTAADKDNMFDFYNKQGPLYLIIDKQYNEKYQLHLATESSMDAEDIETDISSIFHADELTQIMSVLAKDPQHTTSIIKRFLKEFPKLIQFTPQKTILEIVTADKYGNFIYDIPTKLRTKEICLAAFKASPNTYIAFPDKFKTLALSIAYYNNNPFNNWEAIPEEHREAVREYSVKMKEMVRGIGMWKRSKAYEKELKTKLSPEQQQKPDISPLIKDIEQDVVQSKQHLAGFKDYVKQLRQQKREMVGV